MGVVLQSKQMRFSRHFVAAPVVKLAVLLVLVLTVASGCDKEAGARAEERKPDAIAVTVAPAVVGPVQRGVEVTGTLFGDEEATVSAKVPGRIVAIVRDVGD